MSEEMKMKLKQRTIFVDGQTLPVNEALDVITDEWIKAGQETDLTMIDLRDALKHYYGINCKRVIDHIENICGECGHTKTEDGCAYCILNTPTPATVDLKEMARECANDCHKSLVDPNLTRVYAAYEAWEKHILQALQRALEMGKASRSVGSADSSKEVVGVLREVSERMRHVISALDFITDTEFAGMTKRDLATCLYSIDALLKGEG